MSTLRISNIEAKADSSSPTVDEQLRFTNSDGDLMLYLDGRTAGITTVGINTTNQTIKFDANNNVMVTGIITATEFHGSLAVGTSVTYGDNEKAYFGTGLDLELFHNGTNSVINNTGGALLFQNNGSSSMYIASDGQVSLNNDITFVGASANALWDKSENYFSIPDKIVHSGDTNTAIRFPAADTFSVETGGSERLRITSDGKIGIGQNNPATTLEIKSDAQDQTTATIPTLRITNDDGSASENDITGSVEFFTEDSSDPNHVSGFIRNISETNAGVSYALSFGCKNVSITGDAVEKLRITSDGKVGINESTPLGKLHVKNGDSGATVGASADELVLESSANTGMTILSGTANEGTINFGDSGDNNIGKITYMHNGNYMYFKTNDEERLRITSTGRLGIGEVSPDNTLHITKDGQNHGIKLERTGTNAGSATINCNSFGALALTAGNNLSLYSGGSQQIMFYRGASTEIARFDTSGRFLLGTTTAGESNSAADDFVIGNSGSGNSGMSIITGTGNNGHILFGDGDNNTMGGLRYQHSVDVLQLYAGGSTPFQLKSNALGLHEGYPIANSITIRGAATDDTPLLVLKRHTDGAQSDGEIIGKIQFMSNENNVDSGNHQPRAEIHGVTASTSGAAKMDFYTVPNSTTTPVKAMTINQLGQVTTPSQPSFMANFGGNSNVSHTNGDYLKANNTDHNTGNCYNTSNYRFTAPVTGNYLFYGRANMSGVGSGDYARSFQVRLYKNGSSEQYHMSRTTLNGLTASYPDTSTMVCSINLTVNDYVQLKVNWETDGTLSSTENLHHHGSMFGGYLIG